MRNGLALHTWTLDPLPLPELLTVARETGWDAVELRQLDFVRTIEAGGRPGDLYLEIEFEPHPFYRVEGRDVLLDLPVAPWEAALGASVDILTLDGLQTVKIPENTQTADVVKLKGLGAPLVGGSGRGDLLVHIEVRVPSKLTREQRKLFEQLREILPEENEPKEEGIFEKVKDYFM